MAPSVLVSVGLKAGKNSAQRKHVQHLLSHHGQKGLECKGVQAVYRLEGQLGREDVRKIAEGLLCDPVDEAYAVDARPADAKTLFADVWYKPGVTDPVGDSVLKAVKDLKIFSVQRASSGTRYAFAGAGAVPESRIREFARKELLNPLVQECKLSRQ